jgi:hypothetical protein
VDWFPHTETPDGKWKNSGLISLTEAADNTKAAKAAKPSPRRCQPLVVSRSRAPVLHRLVLLQIFYVFSVRGAGDRSILWQHGFRACASAPGVVPSLRLCFGF